MSNQRKVAGNKGNGKFVYVTIIFLAIVILSIGKTNLIAENQKKVEGVEIVPVTTLTRLNKSEITSGHLLRDIQTYIFQVNKFGALNQSRALKENLVPKNKELDLKLKELKEKETRLHQAINSIPTEEFQHDKMTLASYIVRELKEHELTYEIDFNYDGDDPLDSEKEEEVEEEVAGDFEYTEEDIPGTEQILQEFVGDAFAVTIYEINKGDNYQKLNNVLDLIFIKEPYEITRTSMKYNSLTKSYYLQLVIEV